jgi:hypothetical protein
MAKHKHPPFVMIVRETLDSPAWRAMSHGARSLFIALKRRYSSNYHNNGKIFLSQRDASKEIGSSTEEITRWYRKLQHYGFIVMTAPGHPGVEGEGKAPHWRLTDVGYMKDPPTRDFLKWDGTKFKRRSRVSRRPKTESRPANAGQSVQHIRDTTVPEMLDGHGNKRSANAGHTASPTVPGMRDITIQPSSTPHRGPVSPSRLLKKLGR